MTTHADARVPGGQPAGQGRRRLLAVLIAPAFLLAAEGILRLSGFGGFPPLVRRIAEVHDRTLLEVDWRGADSYFAASRSGRGSSRQQTFFMPKGSNAVRIVLAGESAIKGFPQPPTLCAAAFLQAMLQDAWPGRTVEIINLGTTAVASYPVLDMATRLLAYEPDLVIVYAGNNEFFGAYGVASRHFFGSHPRGFPVARWLHSLALTQSLARRWAPPAPDPDASLMETMMGKAAVAPQSPLRVRAARNLEYHVRKLVRRARARSIPVLVCTLAANERDLAPFGPPDPDAPALPPGFRDAVEKTPASVQADLERRAAEQPDDALGQYLLGRALFRQGDYASARVRFQRAVDLDPLPWRPTDLQNQALRRAAQEEGALLCDVQEAFRARSLGGAVGWDLMDDHVHPTLAGQALLARTLVESLAAAPGPLRVEPADQARLQPSKAYAAALGQNIYDDFGVAVTLLGLFRADFMRRSNPAAVERAEARAREFGARLDPDVARHLEDELRFEARTGGNRPVSMLAGLALLKRGRYAEAEQAFAQARKCLPPYATLSREAAYYLMDCRLRQRGRLDLADQALIREEIEKGQVRLKYGQDRSGANAYYLGRLYELLGERETAARYLAQSDEQRAAARAGR